MSFKVNNRGLRVLSVERACEAELIAIYLLMLAVLLGLATALIGAGMLLCAYSYLSAVIPFTLSLSISVVKLIASCLGFDF